jgi:aryl-alcohol dehydrogenase-like predicted oxidoreductase
VIDASAFDSAQVVYNMLNPSAAAGLPTNYPAQDYGRLFDHTRAASVGVVGIRVLAGGALSGSAGRHPIASPPPEPIGSAMNYDADVARARRLMPLVKEGFAASLTEAATRFALSHPAMGTILVGMATPQQFEDALAAVQKGPLPAAALDRLSAMEVISPIVVAKLAWASSTYGSNVHSVGRATEGASARSSTITAAAATPGCISATRSAADNLVSP